MKYIRQRYILFEILTETPVSIDKDAVVRKIWKKLIRLFGEFTTFHVGLWMIRWDPERNMGILRCDNITKSEVIAVLSLIKHIKSLPVIFHTRKTSGTIKKTLRLWRYYFKSEPPKREDKKN